MNLILLGALRRLKKKKKVYLKDRITGRKRELPSVASLAKRPWQLGLGLELHPGGPSM